MSNQQYIKSLELENFSILPNEKLNFSSGLNVIVAENACGKSHLLKILYCLLSVTSDSKNRLLKTDLIFKINAIQKIKLLILLHTTKNLYGC